MKPERKHFRYYWFRRYVIFFFRLYFPKVYVSGRSDVPEEGTPCLMPGCHQATFIDALAPSLVLGDRRTRGLLRSDVFSIPVLSWFVRKLGMYPIARLNFEGPEAMEKYNDSSMSKAAHAIMEGHSLIMFPEAGHQQGHYLGTFAQSYVRLAMQAAALEDYKRDVVIEPYAVHYDNYHHPFYDMMVMFGKPLSLTPYYERYKEHPLSTRRKISAEVVSRVRELMLDIRDREHYQGIDFLRCSQFGIDYCKAQGGDPEVLPEKFRSDKQLVSAIENNMTEEMTAALDEAADIDKEIREGGMRDWLFDTRRLWLKLIGGIVATVALAPLAAVSFLLTFPVFLLPYFVKTRKFNGIKDPMFSSTCDFVGTIIFTFPIFCVLPVIPLAMWIGWPAVFYPFVALGMILFFSKYQRLFVKTRGLLIFCLLRRGKAKKIADRRTELFEKVKRILNLNH